MQGPTSTLQAVKLYIHYQTVLLLLYNLVKLLHDPCTFNIYIYSDTELIMTFICTKLPFELLKKICKKHKGWTFSMLIIMTRELNKIAKHVAI